MILEKIKKDKSMFTSYYKEIKKTPKSKKFFEDWSEKIKTTLKDGNLENHTILSFVNCFKDEQRLLELFFRNIYINKKSMVSGQDMLKTISNKNL